MIKLSKSNQVEQKVIMQNKKEGKEEVKKLLAEHPDLPLIIQGIKKLNRTLKKFKNGGGQTHQGESMDEGEEKQQKEE